MALGNPDRQQVPQKLRMVTLGAAGLRTKVSPRQASFPHPASVLLPQRPTTGLRTCFLGPYYAPGPSLVCACTLVAPTQLLPQPRPVPSDPSNTC